MCEEAYQRTPRTDKVCDGVAFWNRAGTRRADCKRYQKDRGLNSVAAWGNPLLPEMGNGSTIQVHGGGRCCHHGRDRAQTLCAILPHVRLMEF